MLDRTTVEVACLHRICAIFDARAISSNEEQTFRNTYKGLLIEVLAKEKTVIRVGVGPGGANAADFNPTPQVEHFLARSIRRCPSSPALLDTIIIR